MSSSESESECDLNIWNFKSHKTKHEHPSKPTSSNSENQKTYHSLNNGFSNKFMDLKEKRQKMSANTKRRQDITQSRIEARKKNKTVLDDATSKETVFDRAMEEWSEVKSYLNVNEHLHGPVKHGKYGPKTELEQKIDDALEDGEIDYAEVLSDQLSNREFAVKINAAFAAKKFVEKQAVEKSAEKAKQRKKLYWGFEAKNRWEMKGNM